MIEEVALSTAAQAGELLPETPYVGLVPYREEDAPFFFGRDEEKQIVAGNLRASRLTILYGPSGVGKTSLLQAGVVHELRRQVQERADGSLERAPFAICSFNAWRDEPLPALVEAIRAAAAEALGGLAPEAWRPGEPLVESLRAWTGRVRTLLVVLDQFEDYFLYHPEDDGEGSFFVEFPRIVNEPNLRVNFLLSIREDSWAKLDRFEGRIPRLFVNYVRVEHLDREAAHDAIEEPVAEWNRRLPPEEQPYTVEPALVGAVTDAAAAGELTLAESGGPAVLASEAAGGYAVEAPFLQLVMERLWRATVAAGSRDLSLARLEELGGAQRIVENHLLEALAALTSAEQEVAADLFRFLVSPSKRKIAQSVPDLIEWTKRPEPEVAPVLDKLSRGEGGRILRAISPPAGESEATRYELYHDVLAEPIVDWRRRYEHARDRRRTIRRFAVFGSGMLALVAAFAGLAAWALLKQHEADRASRNATSLALASAGRDQLGSRLDQSLLLSLEAIHAGPSPQARDSMISALEAAHRSGVEAIMRGHISNHIAVAFGPDGRMLATADADGMLRLWDVRTHRQLGQPLGDYGPVKDVAFSADGRILATAGDDKTLRLWDARTLDQLGPPLRGGGVVSKVALSPDGRTLASAATAAEGGVLVRLWDVRMHHQLGQPLRGGYIVSSLGGLSSTVAFSPDGRTLASGGNDKGVRLWDVRTHRQLGQPLGDYGPVGSIAFSPDGRRLASTSGQNGAVRLWDVRTHRQLGQPLRGGGAYYGRNHVVFSPDGRTLASASNDDGTVRLWDVRTHRQLGQPLRGGGFISDVAFSPDARTLASADSDGTLQLWDVRAHRQPDQPLRGGPSSSSWRAFSPDGRMFATADGGTVRLWHVRTPRKLGEPLRGNTDYISDVAFSADGRTLATASDEKTVRLWNVRTHRPLGKPLRSHVVVSDVALSPDGRTLASSGSDGTVRLWDVRTHRQLEQPLRGNTDYISDVAFSPDGRMLASAGSDETVRLWDVRTHRQLGQPLRGGDSIWGFAFSPDARMLAIAAADGTVRLWDVRAHRQLGQPLRGHTNLVQGLAFSPDGRTLASAGSDRTVRLWDVRTHLQLGQPLRGHTSNPIAVAFSPDGRTLTSANEDGTERLWDGILWRDFDDLKQQVCSLVVGNLTKGEWKELAPGLSYHTTCPS